MFLTKRSKLRIVFPHCLRGQKGYLNIPCEHTPLPCKQVQRKSGKGYLKRAHIHAPNVVFSALTTISQILRKLELIVLLKYSLFCSLIFYVSMALEISINKLLILTCQTNLTQILFKKYKMTHTFTKHFHKSERQERVCRSTFKLSKTFSEYLHQAILTKKGCFLSSFAKESNKLQ